ncbi:hypothetical protein [Pseudomonas sp. RIT-PI-S]|uniref:hypothetical protein n=1 Tax=Pseudomonas sp. RIT-PI-S TaxID=3035295 RepID=UPI0021DA7AA0|nr:hypothetical protein [Pseudomonas sp. RIT-PI-S]
MTQDKIDVAALGYTGLRDGTNGTLKLVYDTDLHRTYLKDYDLNAEGQRFEIALEGGYTRTFTANNLVVASTVSTAEHSPDTAIELVGVAPSDVHWQANILILQCRSPRFVKQKRAKLSKFRLSITVFTASH